MSSVLHAPVEGWMGRKPRLWLAEMAKQHERIVEVGCWKGRSTAILAEYTRGTVWAVDHWQGTPHDEAQHALYPDAASAFGEFLSNLKHPIERGKVRVVRMPSVEAAACLAREAPFDFVFIDADHSYDAVKADIAAWLPLVGEGGTLAGHDYKLKFPGVVRAVVEAFGGRARVGPASIWSVQP